MAERETEQIDHTDIIKTGTFFTELAKDPKYRTKVLGLIKEVNPNASIPELDLQADFDARVEAKVKPYEEKVSALTEKLDKLQGHVARDSWAAKQGLAEEELVEVEELAKSQGITKGETAVEYWRMKQQLGAPRSTRKPADDNFIQKISKISPMNGPALKRAASEEALRILSEGRNGRIRSA